MNALVQEVPRPVRPEKLAEVLPLEASPILLQSALFGMTQGRYSLLAADPFLVVRVHGATSHLRSGHQHLTHYGDPWLLLENLQHRYELQDGIDVPFPLGGCFGYWGYGLRHFLEPCLSRKTVIDLELPDAYLSFCDSLVVIDHALAKSWIVSTGLTLDGSRSKTRAEQQLELWTRRIESVPESAKTLCSPLSPRLKESLSYGPVNRSSSTWSSMTAPAYIEAIGRAKDYIRRGHIYQVNLAHRISAHHPGPGWTLYNRLRSISPAPFAAWVGTPDFELISSSPELFLRIHDRQITTRPIKGTRPRSTDPLRDTQLTYELQTSEKELAELVMITDLLRNDLGKICSYGSIQVPDLAGLERYAQVQHLVSTVEGQLRSGVSHLQALAACFPGGSITGAPKIRAMQIIDELESVARGPYTGALGYLGFNRVTELSILIRTALQVGSAVHFHAGAGIVADSDPAAEYEETLVKARGFFSALQLNEPTARPPRVTPVGLL